MNTIEVVGISTGLGALSLAKQLRRINETMISPKMKAMQNVMKTAKSEGLNPREALKNFRKR